MFDEQHLAGASARIATRKRGAQEHAVIACGVYECTRQSYHLADTQLREFRTDVLIGGGGKKNFFCE